MITILMERFILLFFHQVMRKFIYGNKTRLQRNNIFVAYNSFVVCIKNDFSLLIALELFYFFLIPERWIQSLHR